MHKRRVTMTNYSVTGLDSKGKPVVGMHQAVDYVPDEILDGYVTDARTKWAHVEVSDEVDHGPGGVDGETHIPDHLVRG